MQINKIADCFLILLLKSALSLSLFRRDSLARVYQRRNMFSTDGYIYKRKQVELQMCMNIDSSIRISAYLITQAHVKQYLP